VGQAQPWYLVSDQPGQADLRKIYGRRMCVKEMSSDLKGRGFDLEASQLKQTDRIGRLFLGFGIVFVWLITRGNWVVIYLASGLGRRWID